MSSAMYASIAAPMALPLSLTSINVASCFLQTDILEQTRERCEDEKHDSSRPVRSSAVCLESHRVR